MTGGSRGVERAVTGFWLFSRQFEGKVGKVIKNRVKLNLKRFQGRSSDFSGRYAKNVKFHRLSTLLL